MKRIALICVSIFVITNIIYSQDIINETGAEGKFIVRDSEQQEVFVIDEGDVSITGALKIDDLGEGTLEDKIVVWSEDDKKFKALYNMIPKSTINASILAADSWTEDGSGNIYRSTGYVGIGTTTPQRPLDIQPSVSGSAQLMRESDSDLFAINLKSLANRGELLLYRDGAITTKFTGFGDSYFTGGKVGIGIASPDEELHVAGEIRLDGAFEDKDGQRGTAGQILSSTGSATDWIDATSGVGGADGDWTISGSNLFPAVAGNVGIGTTNPLSKLSVGGDGNSNAIIYSVTALSNGQGIYGHATNAGNGVYNYGGKFQADGEFGRGVFGEANSRAGTGVYGSTTGTDGTALYGYATGDDAIGVGGSALGTNAYAGWFEGRGFFSGNVGIGTLSPDEKLHVAGNMRLDSAFEDKDGDKGTAGQVLSSTGTATDWIAASGSSPWTENSGNIYYNSGNVGIGIIGPSSPLHIVNSAGPGTLTLQSSTNPLMYFNRNSTSHTYLQAYNNDFYIKNTISGGNLFLGTNNLDRVTINASGNVGIGNTAPAYPLTVEGTTGGGVGDFQNNITSSDQSGIYASCNNTDFYGFGGSFIGGYVGAKGTVYSTGNESYMGLYGESQASAGEGVNYGVYGDAQDGSYNYGVYGKATGGNYAYGVVGEANSALINSLAGNFIGNVDVSGILSKGGGSFKIDHPLDPANKYLSHSFVESPDMMNVYNGNTVLNSIGEAVIELPDYFEALNRDFRYQLTAIGSSGPDLYIADKVSGNQFKIAGGEPGMEVSWQVTGIRQDAFANANRVQVEVDKRTDERGKYMHPELYGLDRSQSEHYVKEPQKKKAIQ